MQNVYEQHEREKDEQMNIIRQHRERPKKYKVLPDHPTDTSYYKHSADQGQPEETSITHRQRLKRHLVARHERRKLDMKMLDYSSMASP